MDRKTAARKGALTRAIKEREAHLAHLRIYRRDPFLDLELRARGRIIGELRMKRAQLEANA